MTSAVDAHDDAPPTVRFAGQPARAAQPSVLAAYDRRPVEFWPTAAVRMAVETGDLAVWQKITVAIKRDPYGRTARQVEEVLETTSSVGITKALSEVLARSREHLEQDERAEVATQVQALIDRSGLGPQEFASRIGVADDDLASYLDGDLSPSAAQLVRMHRLADRFAKMAAQRSKRPG